MTSSFLINTLYSFHIVFSCQVLLTCLYTVSRKKFYLHKVLTFNVFDSEVILYFRANIHIIQNVCLLSVILKYVDSLCKISNERCSVKM